VKEALAALAQRGILALPAGEQVLRFLPPFIIQRSSIDEVAASLCEAIS
jgi:acetylornithine/succinyldiaminopimelate/putrescine aminotransferase